MCPGRENADATDIPVVTSENGGGEFDHKSQGLTKS